MKVIGIKFKEGGKIYYFAPKKNEKYEEGMQVIVETSKSVEFATVAFPPKEVDESEVVQPLKPILRIATDKDREQIRKNAERKPQAMKIAQEKVEKHNLKMKLIDCEFTFDGSKIIFYFSADGRVDFRELVKDLASVFHIRIELRQVGARDETKLLGGIAPCGRECCCAGAMPDFRKVSIKMAKVQGLSLNPGKISGLCGRLMCCLSYENDYYSEVYKKMPKVGSEVSTPGREKGRCGRKSFGRSERYPGLTPIFSIFCKNFEKIILFAFTVFKIYVIIDLLESGVIFRGEYLMLFGGCRLWLIKFRKIAFPAALARILVP